MSEDPTPFVNPVPTPHEQANLPTTRLVMIGTLYHQVKNDQPTGMVHRTVRWLVSNEALYAPKRQVSVSQEWQRVSYGWVEEASLLVIQNNAPKVQMKKERTTDRAGVLEVSFGTVETPEQGVGMWASTGTAQPVAHCLILPGEFLQVSPLMPVYVRCREGAGSYSVVAVEE